MSVCLYSCRSYTSFKVHAPYYIVICGLSGCTIFFPIVSYPARFLGKGYSIQNVCFDFLEDFSLKLFHLRRLQRDTIINTHKYSCKVPVLLVRF